MFASKDVSIGLRAAYPIARSVRLRSSASAYLSRTPASASNRKTWTWSGWVKRGTLGSASIQSIFSAGANASYPVVSLFFFNDFIDFYADVAGTATRIRTNAVYRDPSAWYHIVAVLDTTQATAANRMLLYVNGAQVTSFSTSNPPAQNADLSVNNTVPHYLGAYCYDTTINKYDGYLTEINFIDGQALTPSSFGAFNIYGVWAPAKYQGTYGTNGFYLNFSDNSAATAAAIGKDSSGNGNNWTPNGINLTTPASTNTNWDSMTDVPTLTSATAANYAVLNAVYGSQGTLSNGNLTYASTGDGTGLQARLGTIGVSSGKWYFEVTVTSSTSDSVIGIVNNLFNLLTTNSDGSSNAWINKRGTGGTSFAANGATSNTIFSGDANGDVVQIAFDASASKFWIGRNGTWAASGDPANGTNAQFTNLTAGANFYPLVRGAGASSQTSTLNANFGQRPFTYTPPTGFVALNTFNLSAPPIPKGAAYMAATTYTGTGATQSITNTVNSVSFQPDLVWVKARNSALSNSLYDVLRGVRVTLSSNLTNAENAEAAGVSLTAFNSNGFSVGTDNVGYGSVNGNGNTYVAWQWKANGAGVSNTSGSITSTVSAGATQGFSVATYTGTGAAATVGHGLGAVPSMIIVKKRSGAGTTWAVYNVNIGAANSVSLNSTAASSAQNYWNSTTPTSSVWSMSGNAEVNGSAETYVAYCFAAVAGYSAFGSYTGNGSTDGPFVYLGFRPRFLLIKRTDAIANWRIHDTSRDPGNVTSNSLYPNLSNAETSAASEYWDMLSNGFKLRTSDAESNASAGTYIYAAFAENPLKYSLAR